MKLILASSSPYRQAQLKQLGLSFECLSPDVDEQAFKQSALTPKDLSLQLSYEKAKAILNRQPDAIVIGADQVCCLNSTILSKPGNFHRALEQLSLLQGQTHSLYTSYTVLSEARRESVCVEAKLTMRSLNLGEMTRYLQLDEPYHSCGSYRLEALGISLFSEIECDDHTSIIGLPLLKLAQTLRTFGLTLP